MPDEPDPVVEALVIEAFVDCFPELLHGRGVARRAAANAGVNIGLRTPEERKLIGEKSALGRRLRKIKPTLPKV